jgi:hypothetical protein
MNIDMIFLISKRCAPVESHLVAPGCDGVEGAAVRVEVRQTHQDGVEHARKPVFSTNRRTQLGTLFMNFDLEQRETSQAEDSLERLCADAALRRRL